MSEKLESTAALAGGIDIILELRPGGLEIRKHGLRTRRIWVAPVTMPASGASASDRRLVSLLSSAHQDMGADRRVF